MKKLLSVILSITMLMSFASALAIAEKTDEVPKITEVTASEVTVTTVSVPNLWARESVQIAIESGIVEEGKAYSYTNPITRAEFCGFIYNLLNICADLSTETDVFANVDDTLSEYENPFLDTSDEKITTLNALGIINGKSGTEFAPEDYLTREEAATIIIRMINKIMPMGTTEMWFEYDDIGEVSAWAFDAVQIISNLGIMNGVGDNRFAPEETYTTEQAIVTLVRTGEKLGITNDDAGDVSAPAKLDVTETVSVNKFYIDEAIKLTTESGKLAADKDFISYYTTNEDMTDKVMSIGAVSYDIPTDVYYMAANREQIIANLKAFASEDLDGVDVEKLLKLNKVDFSVLGNLINSSYGAENLAALAILTNGRGYIMPKDFKKDFALYLQYDGEYSSLVSFSEFGDGVIKATMSFVNNGDRDNIFSRLYEITQGLGQDSINVARVE